MPGDTSSAGHENPYRASQPLDPRVDGSKPRQEPTTSRAGAGSGFPTAGTAGSGAATTGASQAFDSGSTRSYQPNEPTHSTLTSTSTTDPADRSAGYTDSATTRGPDYATPGTSSTSHQHTGPGSSALTSSTNPVSQSREYASPFDTEDAGSTPAGTSTSATTGHATAGTEPHAENQGMMSKVLGAVGLGGAGTAAASALGYGSKTDEPHDTSAIATQPGRTSSETGPPTHYRRESIPTTAYPAGLNSPRAVAPPVGGSQVPAHHSDSRDTAYGSSQIPGSHDTARGSALGSSQVPTHQTTAVDTDAGAPHATIHDLITTGGPRDDSNTSRNIALGGAAASAAGAGAYGLHEHSRDHPSAATGNTALPDSDRRLAQPSTTIGTGIGHHDGRDTHDSSSTSKPSITERIKEALPGVQSEREKNESGRSGVASAAIPERSHAYPSGTTGATDTSASSERSHAYPSGSVGTTTFPDRTRDSPLSAVAAAPSRYDSQDARAPTASTGPTTKNTEQPLRDESHTGRNTALGAGTAAGVGGLAYAAHERNEDRERLAEQQREAQEKAQREHHKELERQEKQHQKDIEHQQKQVAKEEKHHQHEAEKAEKQHQKELEKEQKHRQHELEKEEKERQAVAAAQEKREKARLVSEEEERKRHAREEAGAATAGGAALGAGAGAAAIAGHRDEGVGRGSYDQTYGRDQQDADLNSSTYVRREVDHTPVQRHADHATHQEHHEKEKKPSIFKRIFKSRKNKDTGEDEDYSTDDEEDKARHYGAAGTTGAVTGSHVPTHHSDTKGRTVLGSDPGRHSTEHLDPTTGLPYDASKDPEAARRLSREPGAGAAHGRGTDSAPYGTGAAAGTAAAGLGGYTISNTGDRAADDRHHATQPTSSIHGHDTTSTGHSGTTSGLHGEKPIDHHTGLPYDPSKDPEAAARLSESTGHHGPVGSDGLPQSAHEPFGVIGDHHR